MGKIIDKHAPLKKLSKYKLKFKNKPWITTTLQRSVSIMKKLFRDFINEKYFLQKTELHIKYKSYRNLLSTLMRNSKGNYFGRIFEDNLKYLISTWKGIKSMISMKSSSSNSPTYSLIKMITLITQKES